MTDNPHRLPWTMKTSPWRCLWDSVTPSLALADYHALCWQASGRRDVERNAAKRRKGMKCYQDLD